MYDRTKLKAAVADFCGLAEVGTIGPGGGNTSPAGMRAMREAEEEIRALRMAGDDVRFVNGPAKFKWKKIESLDLLAEALSAHVARHEKTRAAYKLSNALVEAMKGLHIVLKKT